ncbi:MAG: four helix bundle protein [Tepidisphaeraceae bacterium]
MYAKALTQVEAMKARTKRFALRVPKLFRALHQTEEARVIGHQMLRSGTSVGANYRAVCRARSRREFVSKMNVVVEEADETVFWFELRIDGGIVPARRLSALMGEGNELLAIFAASVRTVKKRLTPKGMSSNGSMTQSTPQVRQED